MRVQRLHRAVGGLALLWACGCSDSATQQQLDDARQAVTKSLETWQSGAKAETLKSATPAIDFNDDDWQKAARLVEFQLLDAYLDSDGTPRCHVKLVVQHARGQPVEQRVTYQIVQKDLIVIARDPFS